MRVRYDWNEVQRYYDRALSRNACVRKFGFALVTWYKAIRRGKLRAQLERAKRYDWRAIQRYHDEGRTFRECRARFGFANASWAKAIQRGDLKPRAQRWPLEKVLAQARCRNTVKRRLLEAGILKNVCEACGISEWRGAFLSIQLHHRNGVRDDNRLENLEMLCPNCHSQTESYASKNRSRLSRVM
jgi:Zn finger protein HypA/HybF involved in hydrogenase expression